MYSNNSRKGGFRMRIKANKEQLDAIVLILGQLLDLYPAENMAEELIEELVDKIYTKLYTQSRKLYVDKNSWAFSLNSLEAKAFHIFYQNTFVDAEAYRYEAIQLQNMFNQIDQKYGRVTPRNNTNRELATGTPARRLGSPTR